LPVATNIATRGTLFYKRSEGSKPEKKEIIKWGKMGSVPVIQYRRPCGIDCIYRFAYIAVAASERRFIAKPYP
jgi:hypothetical protein